MVGVLIVSHGRLAEALISSVQSLVGNLQRIIGVSVWPKDREEDVKDRIREKMAEVDDGDGIIILTDILGGTPTNLSLSFLKDEKVKVVTGVNMPMLLTLSSYRKGKSLREIGTLVKKSGRRSILLVKEVLGLRRREKVIDVKCSTYRKMIMDVRDTGKLFQKTTNKILLSRCPWGEAIRSDVLKGYLKHPGRLRKRVEQSIQDEKKHYENDPMHR